MDVIKFDNKDDFTKGVEAFKRDIETHIDLAKHVAKIRRASFDAYVSEGFSADQALELCKNCLSF